MKTIGIVTIYDSIPNYGNKLQNYATKCLLENYGYKVATVVTEPQPSIFSLYFKKILNGVFRCRLRGKVSQASWNKDIKFYKFNKKYLLPDYSFLTGNYDSNKYDYFAIGSDQVWNPEWYDRFLPKKDLFLLTFAKPEQKICIAPSFGTESIPKQWIEHFSKNLQTFPNLAVREKEGIRLIKRLTGKPAKLLIDPTLMLDQSEWSKIAKKPLNFNDENKFIITYFIGEQTAQTKAYIDAISQKYQLSVYNLNDVNDLRFYDLGPEEFLYMIKNSRLVMTDSFHACVFSFLFERPFEVFERKSSSGNMMSRINTLLQTFDLERKYKENNTTNEIFECDYSVGLNRLTELRRAFDDYIENCVNS